MNGFLLVAVCSLNDVPLRLYDEHGQHAAQIEADACNQAPQQAKDRYKRAFEAVGCWAVSLPYAFRVLQIVAGEVAGCVYDTDAEPSPMTQDLADYD
jgi:hypothetical protein